MPAIDFTPTIASIPPSNALLRRKEIPEALPNLHPLVNIFQLSANTMSNMDRTPWPSS